MVLLPRILQNSTQLPLSLRLSTRLPYLRSRTTQLAPFRGAIRPSKAFQSQASDSAAPPKGDRMIAKSSQALRFALAPSPPLDYFELFNIPRNANKATIKKP